MIRINNIKIKQDISDEDVFNIAINKYHINKSDVLEWHIAKKSIDARKKEDVHYNYCLDLKVKNENKYNKLDKINDLELPSVVINGSSLPNQPVIVGAGPSGLFAALVFVENGIAPIIIEQGQNVDDRKKTVDSFLLNGKLNPLSNVQFGEGGAGTFSDGKLTSGINSKFCKRVLQEFVRFGAPESILYLSKPHIGTDNLINIIRNIRNYIISKGRNFPF